MPVKSLRKKGSGRSAIQQVFSPDESSSNIVVQNIVPFCAILPVGVQHNVVLESVQVQMSIIESLDTHPVFSQFSLIQTIAGWLLVSDLRAPACLVNLPVKVRKRQTRLLNKWAVPHFHPHPIRKKQKTKKQNWIHTGSTGSRLGNSNQFGW